MFWMTVLPLTCIWCNNSENSKLRPNEMRADLLVIVMHSLHKVHYINF